ncbi:MAG: glucose-6-phosphate isomerase [Alphaproteobacteria bacterium]|nr:glucose-6-phosphate isomerase [Alphaproteobacteria bacterium]NCQ67451.1 glucose-6-phosphate isomerase [Alphaproteobacteria bacterium]NCT08070.1 glucose-6-phosphate isomerase [Alphaproteobacteria bacterium]
MNRLTFSYHNVSFPPFPKEPLRAIREKFTQKAYPFFNVLGDELLLSQVEEKVQVLYKTFTHFVILGTGGSSLGAKTLCDLKNNPFGAQKHHVHFLNNVDSHTIEQLLASLDLEQTCFIAVSKSGTTAETLCQTLCIMKALEVKGMDVKKHFEILTENKDSPLTQLAETYLITPLDHHKGIGGRFSVFSNVGLLPAALAGINIRSLHNAAQSYVAEFQESVNSNDMSHPVLEGSLFAFQAMENAKPIAVMMPYVDRLASFSQWHAQLWAESLGKQGKGSTPVAALGTVDQHSQLQLYNDGPNDKTYTFLVEDSRQKGLVPNAYVYTDAKLSYLEDRTMGDLLYAEARATIDSLIKVGRPLRAVAFKILDEAVLGELLAHFMLETILTAELLTLDAFDQPGVEESKRLTRHYLSDKQAS